MSSRVQHRKAPRSHCRNPGKTARHAVEAMAAAAALAGGTQAYAAPVRFDNSPGAGHFDWSGAFGSMHVLDITASAAAQTDSGNPDAGFAQKSGLASGSNPSSFLYGVTSGRLESNPGAFLTSYIDDVSAGATIPSGLSLSAGGVIYYNYNGTLYSLLPNGANAYIGVQFTDAGGVHNGWIGVTRNGRALDAFAWGYETTAGAAIAAGAATGATPLPGDMNDDGAVNALDVPAFVAALLGLPLPPGSVNRADMNASGAADGQDVQPFVNAVVH